MRYLKFTYVDAITGVPVAADPALNGLVFPDIEGLEFAWARKSDYPTNVPAFFGTCPDGSNTQADGVMGLFSQSDWEQMRADEIEAGVVQEFEAETAAMTASYSQAEIDTFSTQEAEAVAYTADNTAPTPLLDAIVSESGEVKASLISKVLIKAAALKVLLKVS